MPNGNNTKPPSSGGFVLAVLSSSQSPPVTLQATVGQPFASALPRFFLRTCERERRLERSLNTQCAQSGPRLSCALSVSISMQVKDWGLAFAPRASTGRAWHFGSFLRSFIFRQILSGFKGITSLGVAIAAYAFLVRPVMLISVNKSNKK